MHANPRAACELRLRDGYLLSFWGQFADVGSHVARYEGASFVHSRCTQTVSLARFLMLFFFFQEKDSPAACRLLLPHRWTYTWMSMLVCGCCILVLLHQQGAVERRDLSHGPLTCGMVTRNGPFCVCGSQTVHLKAFFSPECS